MSDGLTLNDANINGVLTDRRGLQITLNALVRCGTAGPSGSLSGTIVLSSLFGLRQELTFNSTTPVLLRTFTNIFRTSVLVVFRNVVITSTSLGISIPNSIVVLRARQLTQNRWIGQFQISNPLGLRFQGTGLFTGSLGVSRNVSCRLQPGFFVGDQQSSS